MPVLREGIDRQEYGEAPPPVLQGVGSGGGPTAVSGEWPEEEEEETFERSGNRQDRHRENSRG